MAVVIKNFMKFFNFNDNDKILVMTGRYSPISNLRELFYIIEHNNIVVSGLPGIHGGKYNSMWFCCTIKIMKEVVNKCITDCLESIYNFECNLSDVVDKYNGYKYHKKIYVLPTFVGGNNFPISYI